MTALIHQRGAKGLREVRVPCVLTGERREYSAPGKISGVAMNRYAIRLVEVLLEGEGAPRWIAEERVGL